MVSAAKPKTFAGPGVSGDNGKDQKKPRKGRGGGNAGREEREERVKGRRKHLVRIHLFFAICSTCCLTDWPLHGSLMLKISSVSTREGVLQVGRMDDAEEFSGALEEKLLGVQNGFLEIRCPAPELSASSLLVGTLPSALCCNAVWPYSGRSGEVWMLLCYGDIEHSSVPSIAKGFLKLITGLAQVIV